MCLFSIQLFSVHKLNLIESHWGISNMVVPRWKRKRHSNWMQKKICWKCAELIEFCQKYPIIFIWCVIQWRQMNSFESHSKTDATRIYIWFLLLIETIIFTFVHCSIDSIWNVRINRFFFFFLKMKIQFRFLQVD